MTGADRAWANHYETGDIVRYARGSKNIGIETGSYGTVASINPSENLLTVETQPGGLATYDPREFSVGDRIQFTAPDKQFGVANRDLAIIESMAPDGRIGARLDDDPVY